MAEPAGLLTWQGKKQVSGMDSVNRSCTIFLTLLSLKRDLMWGNVALCAGRRESYK